MEPQTADVGYISVARSQPSTKPGESREFRSGNDQAEPRTFCLGWVSQIPFLRSESIDVDCRIQYNPTRRPLALCFRLTRIHKYYRPRFVRMTELKL